MKSTTLAKVLFTFFLGACIVAPSNASEAPSVKGLKILLVNAGIRKKSVVDDHIKAHLESLGCIVTMQDGGSVPEARTGVQLPAANTDGQDLVIISSTVTAITVAGRFKHATVPVILWDPGILDDMSMTGKHQDVDWGEDEKAEQTYLYLVNAPHPLQAGLPNEMLIPFTLSQKKISWGQPGPAAIVIATLPGEPRKACIFGYDKGALMDYDFPAPARRVFLFLEDKTFDNLNEAGLKLFDAALYWGAGKT